MIKVMFSQSFSKKQILLTCDNVVITIIKDASKIIAKVRKKMKKRLFVYWP